MMLKHWLLAFRPKTLTAAFVPIVVATSLVYAEGQFLNLSLSVFALLSALCIQIATNLFNDFIDFKKGADTTYRIGPQRMTQSQKISEKSVFLGGVFFLVLAMILGTPLVIKGGLPFVIIGLLSLFMAYSYTGGPFPLAYLGLGDLFVILFFGIIAVGGVYYLHTNTYTLSALVAGLQVGFTSTVLIAINNFRDMEQDRIVNKNTLAVRFGSAFSRREIFSLYILTLSLGAYWLYKEYYVAAFLPFFCVPLMSSLVVKIYKTKPSEEYNKFLSKSALIQVLFSVLITLGFISQA